MAPTGWEFRNKLLATLSAARHNGQHYVDVESGNLHAELGGDDNSSQKIAIFHDIMTRMMRPGDSILKESGSGNRATMLIRYRLKADHEN